MNIPKTLLPPKVQLGIPTVPLLAIVDMRVEVVSYITLGERCVNFMIMGCPLRAEDITILISSKLTTCLSVFVIITVLASQGSFRKKEELIMLHRAHQSLKNQNKIIGLW